MSGETKVISWDSYQRAYERRAVAEFRMPEKPYLTKSENLLLDILQDYRVKTYEQISHAMWNRYTHSEYRIIVVVLSHLRKKLAALDSEIIRAPRIKTIRGVGLLLIEGPVAQR